MPTLGNKKTGSSIMDNGMDMEGLETTMKETAVLETTQAAGNADMKRTKYDELYEKLTQVNDIYDGTETSINNVFTNINLGTSAIKNLSRILSIKSFSNNVVATSELTTRVTEGTTTVYVTVEVSSSILLLPEKPMMGRFDNQKVGYFTNPLLSFSDAISNYGLVLAEDIIKDESSWFPPLVIWKGVNPNVVRMRVSEQAESSYTGGNMKKGDYFNVYIETIPDLKKDENGNSIEGYAIFFLR